MTTTNPELSDLESQIDKIIKSHQQISLENASLRKQNSSLNNELSASQDKNKKATELLRRMLTKLQDELTCRTQQIMSK